MKNKAFGIIGSAGSGIAVHGIMSRIDAAIKIGEIRPIQSTLNSSDAVEKIEKLYRINKVKQKYFSDGKN